MRYADDVAVYVRTPKAAERVKLSLSRFITGRPKLSVNEEKSSAGRPWHSKYLKETSWSAEWPGTGPWRSATPASSSAEATEGQEGTWRLSKNGTVCAALPDDWFTRSAGAVPLVSFCQ